MLLTNAKHQLYSWGKRDAYDHNTPSFLSSGNQWRRTGNAAGSPLVSNLCKTAPPLKQLEWPRNVCSVFASAHNAAATGKAWAAHEDIFTGVVISVEGEKVVAEIGLPDDMDTWIVALSATTFDHPPRKEQSIRCTITYYGPLPFINTEVLDFQPLPELKDFGIDRKEWLDWASRINV